MKVSIIIVNYNTKEILKDCLKSLENLKGDFEREIFVVDNASSDGSVKMLRDNFPKVTVIANNENLGFAKANNQAIKKATGDYLLLLNSDTVVKPSSIISLLEFSENDKSVGIVGARLLNSDGTIQPSVFNLPQVSGAIKEYFLGQKGAYEKFAPQTDAPRGS